MARKHAAIFRTIKLSRKTVQRVCGADRGLYEAFFVKGVEEVLKTASGEMIPFCGCVCVRVRA